MKKHLTSFINKAFAVITVLGSVAGNAAAQNNGDATYKGTIGKTLKDSKEWWPDKPKPPKGAPNVIWFLIDDAGFGAASAFGGLAQTPTLDSLANNGLRYTNFHTTAICSPTRAALMTGRNHHSVHMGLFPVTATGFPGYDGRIPFNDGTIAEILHENNYNTFAVGKWHLTPVEDVTSFGPFNRWPTSRGFDHFYGFHLGHTDQFHPNLYEDLGVADVEPNHKILSTLLADKAIKYIANQRSVHPDQPFFLYFATGATHAPHQVEQRFIDMYKGKFDGGWDKYRETVFNQQKKLGVIPAYAKLPDRNPKIASWNSLTPDERKVYAHYMEVYAGFLTQADYEFGRIIQYLKDIGQLDNTAVFAMIGDNGASQEGTYEGTINEHISDLKRPDQIKEVLKNYDKLGTEYTDPNYPLGWAQAANTPFKFWKQDANSDGGTHNPLIVFYPKGIKEKGGIRNQYSHVIDMLPTTVELVGAKIPDTIKGYKQWPVQGNSFFKSFNDAAVPSDHHQQYYEIKGKRAIYKDGWKAEVNHEQGTDFDKDVWELYNLNEDYTERINLAAKNPEKLKELQDLFDSEAKKYNVYPLNDNAKSGGRKQSAYGLSNQIILYPGVDQLLSFAGPQFNYDSFKINADVEITSADNEGVLFSTGGKFGGLSLYIKDHKFQAAHNTGADVKFLESNQPIATGKYKLTFELNFTGSKSKDVAGDTPAGNEVLYINDVKVAERPIVKEEAQYIANYKDGIDVGQDLNSPVTDRYQVPFKFTGKLNKITINYNK